MKIGIITRHHMYHHGAILQAYSLQNILENMGYVVEMIDFRHVSYERANWVIAFQPFSLIRTVSFTHFLKYSLTRIGWGCLNIDRHILRGTYYQIFIKKWMHYSPKTYHTHEELVESPPIYDVYITGSDQIWKINRELGGLDRSFFLDFAPANSLRIAYAASFGRQKLTEPYPEIMQELLKNIDYISIREKSSIPFIQSLTNKDVRHVLDPALLQDSSAWDIVAKNPIVTGDYLFVYSVTWDKNLADFARKVTKVTGLRMVCVGPDYSGIGIRNAVAGPEEFIGYVKNATLIVTDSFHGTVFSLLYRKLFYTYPPTGEETRIIDLLELVHLENRIISSASDNISLEASIPYDDVHQILAEKRIESFQFLKDALASLKE
ncbi:hypothetical protein SDC9_41128 [bioreactor metagenome]|uniref:Polysaccharide pyruvyl transferase domain-containing protein n=1 Tax=bioreactor metagenome TaxID=1076179 RepID=A0A644VU56_9ZZZZ